MPDALSPTATTRTEAKQRRLPKYRRVPEQLRSGTHVLHVNERDLEILDLIERYKFLPSSLLRALVGGNERVTDKHLQSLYHNGYVNRFAFPRTGRFPGENNYYIDSRKTLDLLVQNGADKDALDWTTAGYNSESSYAAINVSETVDDAQGRLMHLKHELMISRFHAMLELGCKTTGGKVELAAWVQGTDIHDHVDAPAVESKRGGARGERLYRETGGTERIPHRPDAYFSLSFPGQDREDLHFFYEADRDTGNTTRIIKKLRGHFHYIVKGKKHQARYKFERVRAVLIETITKGRAAELYECARHPLVSGRSPSPLFWITASPVLIQEREQEGSGKKQPLFLVKPEVIFKRIWASPAEEGGLSLID